MERKAKLTVILLTVLCVIAIITTATFGYLYFNEKSKYDQLKGQTENSNQQDDSKNESDNENGEDDQNTEEENIEPKTLTKDFECSSWTYADTSTKVPHMYIVYKESADVSFENVTKECTNIVMNYKKAKLYMTYSYGEAYDSLLDKKGTEVVILKTENKTIDGNKVTLTLGRQKYTKSEPASSQYPAGYWLNYVNLQSKAACESMNEMEGAVIGYPCFVGANPFVTPAGRFDLFFSKDSTEADILEAVEYFDNVAKNSYYKEL